MKKNQGIIFGAAFFLVILLGAFSAAVGAENLTVYMHRDTPWGGSKPGAWAVKARFNNLVFPSNLLENLSVTMDGKKEEVELQDNRGGPISDASHRTFTVVPTRLAASPGTVVITIKKGLSDATGRKLLQSDYAYTFVPIREVKITSFGTFYRSKKDKGIRLGLSESVSNKDVTKAVEITPAVPNLRVLDQAGRSFSLTGDFELDRDYELKIKPNRVDRGSAVMVADTRSFKGPGVKPEVTLKTERSVVELIGRQLLPLNLANTTKVRCRLTRIPPYLVPSVAVPWSSSIGIIKADWESVLAKYASGKSLSKIAPIFTGDFREDSDVFFSPEATDHVFPYSLPLSFRKNPDKGGTWIARIDDPDRPDVAPLQKIVQITDLSISYRLSEKSLLLWVTSLYKGLPVSGVDLFVSTSDGMRLFVGKTDDNGLLMVKNGQKYPTVMSGKETAAGENKPLDLAKPVWAVAATPSDSCAVPLESFRLTPKGLRQTKKAKDRPDTRTGRVFTERGAYKPGETVHFKFLSRAYRDDRIVSPAGEKVRVEIVNPKGDVLYNKELKLGEFGSCYDSFPTKSFFPTGTYTIRVIGAKPGEILLSSGGTNSGDEDEGYRRRTKEQKTAPGTFTTTFMVQDFKKIRHYVSLSVKRHERPATDIVGVQVKEDYLTVDVKGLYYTGGPVKNGRARWKATLVPVVNTVKGVSGFFFGNEDDKTRFLESGEATLDRNGKLSFTMPLDPKLLTGIYGVEISATVIDIDGEPATDVTTFNPKPKFLVGISPHPKKVTAGYSAPLKVLVVDADGKRVKSGMVLCSIMEQQWFYIRKRNDVGNINWESQKGWRKKISSQQTLTDGEVVFPLDLMESGDYMVEFAFQDASGRYASRTAFDVGWRSYGSWEERQHQKDVKTGDSILLSTNKKEYAIGDSVRMELNTRRPVKKCLVTVERGDILEYKVVEANGRNGKYEFKVKDNYLPNVYVSVIAASGREGFPVYSSQPDSEIPNVYYGWADVAVKVDPQTLKLDIAPGVEDLKGRPGEKTELSFKVTNAKGKGVVSEMTVCVVDEAILALTRYVTPQLWALATFDLPLSVYAGDLRLDLISQDLNRMFTTRMLTGGGMGLAEVNPSLRKDFRPVAYFNAALVTDTSGMAKVSFKLPDTTTAYRVYAVVCDKGAGFVSGQRKMVVTKEFFVEPSLPRFLVPGDKAVFPLSLQNKTKEKGKVTLKGKVSDGLTLKLAESVTELDPWSSSVVKATTAVKGGNDQAVFTFQGRFVGPSASYDDAVEAAIPIHSRFLPVHKAMIGDFVKETNIPVVFPGALKTFDPNDVNPEDFKAYLSVSTTPWSKIAPGLKYLLRYPYGCVEQTSSGVIPLAGIRGLAKSGALPSITAERVDKFLEKGVNRLLSMQVDSGGFAYWPGQTTPSWWGTMYATFALSTAKQAGYEVSDARMKKALQYLREGLFKTSNDGYHGSAWTQELALFNLAMGNMLTQQELAPFFTNFDTLNDQAKGLLLLSAKKIGYMDDAKLKKLFRKLEPRFNPARASYNDSSFREIAVCLMAALEVGNDRKKATTWAGYLLRNLKPEGHWFSTADTGWCLLALTDFFRGEKPGKTESMNVLVDYGGEKPTEVKLSDTTAYVTLDIRKLMAKGSIGIKCDSRRLLNYNVSLTYPDIVTDPSKLNEGFSLHKTMENLNGKDEIRVGDVVRVKLEIGLGDPRKSYNNRVFEYLALVDPVPAGMVPINSELKTEGVTAEEAGGSRGGDYVRYGMFTPSYFEFRDDGVRVFKNRAWGGTYKYSYLARAVAEGEFWMRGSRISLMYDPDYFGRTEARKITILPVGK